MKEKLDFDLACGNNFVYKNLHASIVCVPTVLVFWCAINACYVTTEMIMTAKA